MSGKELIRGLVRPAPGPRPPYVPFVGRIAHRLGQLEPETFATEPQLQTRALVETTTALKADAFTVGWGVEPAVGVEVVRRLGPFLGERGLVACLAGPDVAAARGYCDAGADLGRGIDMIAILELDLARRAKYRTVANACRFYEVPVILAAPGVPDTAQVAEDLGLDGAVVACPTGREAGIVGGGLGPGSLSDAPSPPRSRAFFWTFPGEVPPELEPEELLALGRRLTGG